MKFSLDNHLHQYYYNVNENKKLFLTIEFSTMFKIRKYIIKKDDPLFGYLDDIAHFANNLYNAALFRIRQVLTGVKKEKMSSLEQSVFDEIDQYLVSMNAIRRNTSVKKEKKAVLFERPEGKNSLLSYSFLECLMKVSKNPDYLCLPIQTSQNMIRRAHQDVSNFFASLRAYKENPANFTGKPKLTRYKKKGGVCTCEFTNQDCKVRKNRLHFPKTKIELELGIIPENLKLKKVEVVPHHGVYSVILTFDDGMEIPESKAEESKRIASIDLGVDNIAAIANNIDKPGLLFKGGYIKAYNQLFNKTRSQLLSAMSKGCKPAEAPKTSKRLEKMSLRRNGFMETEFHTIAKKIIKILTEWDIDTLVIGKNNGWKNGCNMNEINNQNFVNIPHEKLVNYLEYLAKEACIKVVFQEESYTSKASFLNMDPIPVYKSEEEIKPKFSGYRECRGMYKIKNSQIRINADLNGSGNILRKAFPNAFDEFNEFRFLKEIKCSSGGAIQRNSGQVDCPVGSLAGDLQTLRLKLRP